MILDCAAAETCPNRATHHVTIRCERCGTVQSLRVCPDHAYAFRCSPWTSGVCDGVAVDVWTKVTG